MNLTREQFREAVECIHDMCIRDNLLKTWIPVSKNYPKPEDEYKHFLTIDDKGEITIQEFLLSLDEEPQPYFTGWRNVVAWMSLPEPYKADGGDSE